MTFLRGFTTLGGLPFSQLAVATAGHADTVNTRELQVRELAPGVYTIRHRRPDRRLSRRQHHGRDRRARGAGGRHLLPAVERRRRHRPDPPLDRQAGALGAEHALAQRSRRRQPALSTGVAGRRGGRARGNAPHDRRRACPRTCAASSLPDSRVGRQRETLRRTAETGVDAKGAPVDAAGRAAAAASLARLRARARASSATS